MAEDSVLIECNGCHARVEGKVKGIIKHLFSRDYDDPTVTGGDRISLLRCTTCGGALIGFQTLNNYEDVPLEPIESWSEAERVWPEPQRVLSYSIPKNIRDSLEEARGCLHRGTYTASVAMTGRALEAVGRHFHTKGKSDKLMLAVGLKELHEAAVIDNRLYMWGKELHEYRNLAAHASGRTFGRADAEDLYDFTIAICEYVFVLADKYEQFMRRKANKQSSQVS